jgi:hypothetical protein
MDEIKLPTWRDLNLPQALPEMIRRLSSGPTVERLLHDRVFHCQRRLQYTYHCSVCGYVHRAPKSTDEYSLCERCQSRGVRAAQSQRGFSLLYPVGSLASQEFVTEVITHMRSNYASYFSGSDIDFTSESLVQFHWNEGHFTASFLGGDQTQDAIHTRAVCKAALLVPFLWDDRFCWRTKAFVPGGNSQRHLIPTLFEVAPKLKDLP